MHVLITGASRGIGLAIAKRFAVSSPDVRLSICSRSAESIETTGAELRESSPNVFTAACDVSNADDVRRFVQHASERHGPIDILVNNAGFGHFATVEKLTLEAFDSVMATNLRGVFLMSLALLPQMKERRTGTILTISSLAGKNGFVGGAAYCASKFGVRGLMQSLFLDVREYDIRVATIFPGSVETEFFANAHAKPVRVPTALSAENIADAVFAIFALPQFATISEIDIRPTNPKKS